MFHIKVLVNERVPTLHEHVPIDTVKLISGPAGSVAVAFIRGDEQLGHRHVYALHSVISWEQVPLDVD